MIGISMGIMGQVGRGVGGGGSASLTLKQNVEALLNAGATGPRITPTVDAETAYLSVTGASISAGAFVFSQPATLTGWIFNRAVRVTGSNVIFRDCRFIDPGTLTAAAYPLYFTATARNSRAEYCEFIGAGIPRLATDANPAGTSIVIDDLAEDCEVFRSWTHTFIGDGIKVGGLRNRASQNRIGPARNIPVTAVPWDAGTAYPDRQWVIFNGRPFMAIQAVPAGNQPSGTTASTAFWRGVDPHSDLITVFGGRELDISYNVFEHIDAQAVGATQMIRIIRNTATQPLTGPVRVYGNVFGDWPNWALAASHNRAAISTVTYDPGEVMEYQNRYWEAVLSNLGTGQYPDVAPERWVENPTINVTGPNIFAWNWLDDLSGGQSWLTPGAYISNEWANNFLRTTGEAAPAPEGMVVRSIPEPVFGAALAYTPPAAALTDSDVRIVPSAYGTLRTAAGDVTACVIRAGARIACWITPAGVATVSSQFAGATVETLGGGVFILRLRKADSTPLVAPITVADGVAAVTPASLGTITVDSASLRFPDGNAEFTSTAAPAYLADGANWAPTGSEIFAPGSPGAFAAMVEVPWEAINLPTPGTQTVGIMGNASSAGTLNQTFGIFAERGNDQTAATIRFMMRDGGGIAFNVPLTVTLQQRRLLMVIRMEGSQLNFELYHRGVRIANAAPAMSTWAATRLRSQLIYGAMGSGTTNAFVSSAARQGFTGSIAWVGYRNAGLTQAECEALSAGGDPLVAVSAAGWRMIRKLTGTDAASLAKPAAATGDATVSMVVINSRSLAFRRGCDLTAAVSGAQSFRANHVYDGRVFGRAAGASQGRVFLSGFSTGISGGVEARIFDAATGQLRRDWTALTGAALTSGGAAWSGYMDSPPNVGWGHIDIRPAAAPSLVQRIRSRTGVGLALGQLGQSQMYRPWQNPTAPVAVDAAAAFAGVHVATRTASTVTTYMHAITSERQISGSLASAANWLVQMGITEPVQLLNLSNPGQGTVDLLNDADTDWNWSDLEAILTLAQGPLAERVISGVAVNWATNFANRVSEVGGIIANNLQPLFEGSFGAGAVESHAINHYLRDGLTFPASTAWALSPVTRYASTVAGTFSADFGYGDASVDNHHLAREQWRAYAAANPSIIAATGPDLSDLDMRNTGGSGEGGPHQNNTSDEGNPRTLRRVIEAALRAAGRLVRVPPSITGATINGARTQITVTVARPSGGNLQTAWAIKGVAVPGGATTVQGFAVRDGSPGSHVRDTFTAEILDAAAGTVLLTKTSGAWAAGAGVRYGFGGPVSFGLTPETDRLFHGTLYESGPDEGGLGLPVTTGWSATL